MKTYRVTVLQTVNVTLDETKFTPAYLAEFRESFYSFYTIEQHAEHLAQLVARGIVDVTSRFIEGYGSPSEIGFHARIVDGEMEMMGEVDADPRQPVVPVKKP